MSSIKIIEEYLKVIKDLSALVKAHENRNVISDKLIASLQLQIQTLENKSQLADKCIVAQAVVIKTQKELIDASGFPFFHR